MLDGLVDAPEIRTVVCRQEGGAAMMAEAYGKLTGKPGICMVTRGPGATNASAGVHIAFQDSTPMILLVGQVGREMVDREAFQEIDYRRMFGQMAKWVAQIDDPARIPEYISRAFHTAVSGRPGPVVLALPEDMLVERAPVSDFDPYKRSEPHPGPADLARFREMLAAAKRPLVVVGGGGWDAGTSASLARFAEANKLPVGASFRCQDYLDNRHPNYVGHVGIGIDPKLGARVRDSDLLIVVGARLGEMTTSGYSLLEIPRPRQGLVHVHAGSDELGRVYRPTCRSTPATRLSGGGGGDAAGGLIGLGVGDAGSARGLRGAAEAAADTRFRADGRGGGLARSTTSGRRDHHQRRRQLRDLGPSLLPLQGLSDLSGADLRVDGLRRTGRGGCQAGASGPNGRLRVRRWLLHDARPGTGDRGAVWGQHHLPGGEQRHVRHHSHAPGARVSEPHQRHRSTQSGLCGACAGLWRPWRGGDPHRGLRRSVRARKGVRPTGVD
ncbi:acetolactate synthase II large subunit [alpha proteobacterium BAL199]|nr:acetolactate synthase II large subunit [alpha proteobacterium BAL199]